MIYERMDKANYLAGNKYRLRCRECERWLPCTSEETWRTHADPHVLPAGVDPKDPTIVSVEETEYADEVAENSFECPAEGCSAEHTGYPDSCDSCGAVYDW